MDQLLDFFRKLGDSQAFMPRWVCGEWSELHGWMYIISDLIIFLAYMAIPVTMLIFVRKRWNDVPFKPVFWLYILFIFLCGMTHLIDAIIFYEPIYRINALVLVLTAVVSMITVGAMVFVLPKALAYKSPVQLSQIVDDKTSQLQERIIELNRLSKNLSRKKEQLEQFAYITSHNLRSPAANLHSLIVLAKASEDIEDSKIILNKISDSADALLHTVNDVSNVIKQSSPQLEATEMSFDQVVSEVLEHHEQELSKIDATIDRDFHVKTMVYPPDHFRSIIQNLIDNAVRYRKKDGPFRLFLRSYKKDGRIHFECEDNGIGIDVDKDGEHVFKLYKTLNRDVGGKGMGLFLIRNQLENLNGFIILTSELGKGTTFIVVFGELETETEYGIRE